MIEQIYKEPVPFCDFYTHISYERKTLDEIRLCLRTIVRRQIMINRYKSQKKQLYFRKMSIELGLTVDQLNMIEEF